jgi:hypothetical protein
MRQHADEGMTRTFYARDFGDRWFERLPKDERNTWTQHLFRQNDFHRVIVDEVTAHDLVSIHEHHLVEWTHCCAKEIGFEQGCLGDQTGRRAAKHGASLQSVGRADNRTEDIAERYTKFIAYLSDHPCNDMTWNVFLDVLKCKYAAEHVVEVSDREVPLDDTGGIYAEMVGQRYCVRPRGWWNKFWRVAMLTTEAVPTRIIETIDRESAQSGEP